MPNQKQKAAQRAFRSMARMLGILFLCSFLLASAAPAIADDPGWYERYLLNAICAQQSRCLSLDEVPAQLSGPLLDIYRPIQAASSIDESIKLFITLERAPNAWALKHYSGLTTGLLRLNPTRDELAFVVAHELAHIELGHYQARISEVSKYYAVAAIFILLSQGNYNPLKDPFFVTVARLGLAAYSRDQETAADVRGVQLVRNAGFDPRGAISLLSRLGATGRRGTGDLFDDHPSIERRIARVQSEISVMLPPQPSAAPTPPATVAGETHEIIAGSRIGRIALGMTVDQTISAMQRNYDDTGPSTESGSSYYRWYLDQSLYSSVSGRPRIVAWVRDGSTQIWQIQVYARQFKTPAGNGAGDYADSFSREFGEPTPFPSGSSEEILWVYRSNLFIAFDQATRIVARVGVYSR